MALTKRKKLDPATKPSPPSSSDTPKKKRGPRKKEIPPEKLRVKLKHRRSRANARERTRMNRLNDALDRLRMICPVYGGATNELEQQQQQRLDGSSPQLSNEMTRKIFDFPLSLQQQHGQNHSHEKLDDECSSSSAQNAIAFQLQRLSKIDTLRLARNYIKTLTLILDDGNRPDTVEYARMLCEGLSQQTTNMICGGLRVSPNLVIWPDVMMDVNRMMFYQYDCCENGRYSLPQTHAQLLPQAEIPVPGSNSNWNFVQWQQAAAAAATFYQQQQSVPITATTVCPTHTEGVSSAATARTWPSTTPNSRGRDDFLLPKSTPADLAGSNRLLVTPSSAAHDEQQQCMVLRWHQQQHHA